MIITILASNESDYANYSEFIKCIEAEMDLKKEFLETSERGVGQFLLSVFSKAALGKLFENIRRFFTKTELLIEYKDSEREFTIKARGKDVVIEDVVAYLTDNKVTVVDEKKQIARYEKPLEIGLKLGKDD